MTCLIIFFAKAIWEWLGWGLGEGIWVLWGPAMVTDTDLVSAISEGAAAWRRVQLGTRGPGLNPIASPCVRVTEQVAPWPRGSGAQ